MFTSLYQVTKCCAQKTVLQHTAKSLNREIRTIPVRLKRTFSSSGCHGHNSGLLNDAFPRCNRSLNIEAVRTLGRQLRNRFHTTSRCNVPPLFAWLIAKPVAKITAMLTGRAFRKWWQSLSDKKRQVLILLAKKNRYKILIFTGSVCGVIGLYYISHLETTPITHRTRFIAFTPKQLKAIADQEYEQFLLRYDKSMVPTSHPVYEIVARVTRQIINANLDIPLIRDMDWTINIINEPEKNAFVLPNGQIFVFTGILKAVLNEDQLGIVLGHEIAHVLLGHAAEQVSFAEFVDGLSIILLAALWAFLPNDGIALVAQWFKSKVIEIFLHMPYNRHLETEADEVGLQLVAKGCFDVRESSAFWECMALESEATGADQIELLSTHPSHQNRADNLSYFIPEAINIRELCKCPPLPHKDPREMVRRLKQHLKKMKTEDEVVLPSGVTVKV